MADNARPTLAEVAQRAGVSLATASRVLSVGDRVVGAELRDRVFAASKELHYTPNAHAQALARATSSTVGVIVHDVADPYFSQIVGGVMEHATEQGLLVMVGTTYRDPERELAYVSALHAQRVRAIVLAGSGFDDPEHNAAMAAELSVYRDGGGRVSAISRHNLAVDTVLPDNRGGAEAMGRALVGLGHEVIGVISGPAQLTTVRDRFTGFRDALRAAGVALPAERVVQGDFSRDGGRVAALRLLDQTSGVTALFALNDLMALGALAALAERGVKVPERISVAGFDDIPSLRDVTPPLTTVRVPMRQLGLRGIALAVEETAAQAARTETLATEVVLRESTRRLAAPAVPS
ncbi:LacI family DNA-binding transcriptional regulator [soil metagenome]